MKIKVHDLTKEPLPACDELVLCIKRGFIGIAYFSSIDNTWKTVDDATFNGVEAWIEFIND